MKKRHFLDFWYEHPLWELKISWCFESLDQKCIGKPYANQKFFTPLERSWSINIKSELPFSKLWPKEGSKVS